jgi:hypothetical protein
MCIRRFDLRRQGGPDLCGRDDYIRTSDLTHPNPIKLFIFSDLVKSNNVLEWGKEPVETLGGPISDPRLDHAGVRKSNAIRTATSMAFPPIKTVHGQSRQ